MPIRYARNLMVTAMAFSVTTFAVCPDTPPLNKPSGVNLVTVELVNDSGLLDEEVFVLLNTPIASGQRVTGINLLVDSGAKLDTSSQKAVPLCTLSKSRKVPSSLTGRENQAYYFFIDNLKSGRLSFSYVTPVEIKKGASPTANENYRYDKMEISYDSSANGGAGGGGGNLTSIDFYGIPLQVEIFHDGSPLPPADPLQTKSFYVSTPTLLKKMAAFSPAMAAANNWAIAADGKAVDLKSPDFSTFLRIKGPGILAAESNLSSAAPFPSFNLYLASLVGKSFALNNPAEGYNYTATVKSDGIGGFLVEATGTLLKQIVPTKDDKDNVINVPLAPQDAKVSVYLPKARPRGDNDPPKSMDFFIYGCVANIDSFGIDGYPFDNNGGKEDTDNRRAHVISTPYAAILRDIHAALNFGYLDSKFVPPGVNVDSVFAETVLPYPFPYGGARVVNDGYYNPFAALFYYHSDSYGHPYSDRLNAASPLYQLIGKDTVRITVLPDERLDAPQARVASITDTSLTFAWDNVDNATGYRMEVTPTNDQVKSSVTTGNSASTGVLTGLSPGTSYIVNVFATDAKGRSSNALAIQGATTGSKTPLAGTSIEFQMYVKLPTPTLCTGDLQFTVNGLPVCEGKQAIVKGDLGLNMVDLLVQSQASNEVVYRSNFLVTFDKKEGNQYSIGAPFILQNNLLPMTAQPGNIADPRDMSAVNLVIGATLKPKPLYQYFEARYPAVQVFNSANVGAGFAPGGHVTVTPGAGQQFGANWWQPGPYETLPLNAAGVQVVVDGTAARLSYVSPAQINFLLPFATAAPGMAKISVQTFPGQVEIASGMIPVNPAAPAFFTLTSNGRGQVIAVQELVISTTPPIRFPVLNQPGLAAARGETITVYGAGLGAVAGAVDDGNAPRDALAGTKEDVAVFLGGQQVPAANIQFSGLAAGAIGVWQLQFKVPDNAPMGDYVPISATIRGIPTPPGYANSIAITAQQR